MQCYLRNCYSHIRSKYFQTSSSASSRYFLSTTSRFRNNSPASAHHFRFRAHQVSGTVEPASVRRCGHHHSITGPSVYCRNSTTLALDETKVDEDRAPIFKYAVARIIKIPSKRRAVRTSLRRQPRQKGLEHGPTSSKRAPHVLQNDESLGCRKTSRDVARPATQEAGVLFGDVAHDDGEWASKGRVTQEASVCPVPPSQESLILNQDSNTPDPRARFRDMVHSLTELTRSSFETHSKVRELIRLPEGLVFDFGADGPLALLDIYRRSNSQVGLRPLPLTQTASSYSELCLFGYVHANDAALDLLRQFVTRYAPDSEAQDSVPRDFAFSRTIMRSESESSSVGSDSIDEVLSVILGENTQQSMETRSAHDMDISTDRHIGGALRSEMGTRRSSLAVVSQNAGPHYAPCVVRVSHESEEQECDRPETFHDDVMPSTLEPYRSGPSLTEGFALARLVDRSIKRLEFMVDADKRAKKHYLDVDYYRCGFWRAVIALLQPFRDPRLIKQIPRDSVERSIRYLYRLDLYQALGMIFVDLNLAQYQFTLRDCEIFSGALANTGDLDGFSRILQILKEQQLQPSVEIWVHFHQMACRFRPNMDQFVRRAILETHLAPQLKTDKRLLMNSLPTDVSEYHELGLGDLEQLIENYDRQNAHIQKSSGEDWFDAQALQLMVQASLLLGQKGLGFQATLRYRKRQILIKGPEVARLGASLMRTFVTHFFHKNDLEGLRKVFEIFSHRHYHGSPDAHTIRMISALIWDACKFNMLRAVWQYSCSLGRIDPIMRKDIRHSLIRPITVADSASFWGCFAGKFAIGLRPPGHHTTNNASASAEVSPAMSDFPTLDQVLDLFTHDRPTSTKMEWSARNDRLEQLLEADCSRRYWGNMSTNFSGLMLAAWRKDDDFKVWGLNTLPKDMKSRQELQAHLAQMLKAGLGTRFGVDECILQPRTWEGILHTGKGSFRPNLVVRVDSHTRWRDFRPDMAAWVDSRTLRRSFRPDLVVRGSHAHLGEARSISARLGS